MTTELTLDDDEIAVLVARHKRYVTDGLRVLEQYDNKIMDDWEKFNRKTVLGMIAFGYDGLRILKVECSIPDKVLAELVLEGLLV